MRFSRHRKSKPYNGYIILVEDVLDLDVIVPKGSRQADKRASIAKEATVIKPR